ncbi:hypothetical protein HDU77_010428 [Chytriomyces hyalinus]|nr:hypothetical protein HDU77_010428 [Chytriomyces hyalinus]
MSAAAASTTARAAIETNNAVRAAVMLQAAAIKNRGALNPSFAYFSADADKNCSYSVPLIPKKGLSDPLSDSSPHKYFTVAADMIVFSSCLKYVLMIFRCPHDKRNGRTCKDDILDTSSFQYKGCLATPGGFYEWTNDNIKQNGEPAGESADGTIPDFSITANRELDEECNRLFADNIAQPTTPIFTEARFNNNRDVRWRTSSNYVPTVATQFATTLKNTDTLSSLPFIAGTDDACGNAYWVAVDIIDKVYAEHKNVFQAMETSSSNTAEAEFQKFIKDAKFPLDANGLPRNKLLSENMALNDLRKGEYIVKHDGSKTYHFTDFGFDHVKNIVSARNRIRTTRAAQEPVKEQKQQDHIQEQQTVEKMDDVSRDKPTATVFRRKTTTRTTTRTTTLADGSVVTSTQTTVSTTKLPSDANQWSFYPDMPPQFFDANTLVERQLNHLASWVHDQPEWWNQLNLDSEPDQEGILALDHVFPDTWIEPMRKVASNLTLLLDFNPQEVLDKLFMASFEDLLPPLVKHLKATVPHVSEGITPTGMLGVMLRDNALTPAVLNPLQEFANKSNQAQQQKADSASPPLVQLINPFLNVVSKDTYCSTTPNALFAENVKVQLLSSDTCLWLPSKFAVDQNGSVTIQSRINNLDQTKENSNVYRAIAGAFETLLPMFERALQARYQPQQQRFSHFRAKRVLSNNHPLKWETARCIECLKENFTGPAYADKDAPSFLLCEACYKEWLKADTHAFETHKFHALQYSAKDIAYNLIQPINHATPIPRLLWNRNLHVITRMLDVHLTPQNPTYKGFPWHIEGKSNQHIVATGIVYLETTNITPSRLTFQQLNTRRPNSYSPHLMHKIHGSETNVVDLLHGFKHNTSNSAEVIGQTRALENRAVVFPNMYPHRIESFSLVDRRKDGHRKALVFFLVYPLLLARKGNVVVPRVISSEFIPRQEKWWVVETIMELFQGVLPRELCALIAEYVPHHSKEEANNDAKRMMKEGFEVIVQPTKFAVRIHLFTRGMSTRID